MTMIDNDKWVCVVANSNAKYKIGDVVTMGEDKLITKYYNVFDPPQPKPEWTKPKSEWIPFRIVRKYNIVDYEYTKDENNGVAITTIHWQNGDTTTCRTTLDKADQYTGFMIAIAKYAMGNKNEATNTADYWINKRPVQLAKVREKAKAEHKDAEVLVHPECQPEVLEHADYIGSTTGIIKYASENPCSEFIIVTEKGVFYELCQKNPDKKFYPLFTDMICEDMKKITLEKVCQVLENEAPQVQMESALIDGAKLPLEKMLELAD